MADLMPNVSTAPSTPTLSKTDSPAKIRDAAQQFESILLGQILESARQGGGWLGTGDDSSSSCAMGFAEQQLATMMAKSGGLGLASMIEQGLQPKT